ncbi:DUF423 domain-containing protein [Caulobacter sp. S45]|uniref:DUF423 domain-containing protein n=1 Tax=Caulobacter sp. S45 TaxID=1641861 RepID=UPI0015773E3C|nr:DUF423 domain-containing protein [Caulobacter sp. S45]
MASGRLWLALAALNGLMAVCAGAFGSHGVADPQVKGWLQTGAQYQLVHAAAALGCFSLLRVMARQAGIAGWLFGVGGLVFGGSLYLLALSEVKLWGAVTPIGGLLMIAGWAVLIWGALTAVE